MRAKLLQLCPTLCSRMNCHLLGSSVHRIFQARVLEWGAIAFYTPINNNNLSLEREIGILGGRDWEKN